MWEITGTLDEASFLDDAVSEIIRSETALLPPTDTKIGHVELHWDNVGNSRAWIQARGGTVDDRTLARMVLASQLASHGFSEASYSFDSFQKTADWNAIMDKARRLVSDGMVQILRNGYNNIVAQIQGDHGQYQSEIWRDDPNSRAITGSDCECGWGEFQNQPRTRQWKKYQDRPCSHILAAFWQSQAMPLDEDANPAGPQDSGGGGGAPPTMGPEADQGFDPAQRSFDPSMAQGTSAPMGGPQGGPEEPPGPSPADVLPQYPMAQMPQPQPQNLTSNPIFTIGPTPTNPVAMPPGGTFSSVQDPWEMLDNGWHFAAAPYEPWEPGSWGKGILTGTGRPIVWKTQVVKPLDEPPYMGAPHHGAIIKALGQSGANARGVAYVAPDGRLEAISSDPKTWSDDDVAQGFASAHPALQAVEGNWVPELRQYPWMDAPPDNPHVSSWKFADDPWAQPLKSGDLVQLRYPDTGVLQGRSEAHGAGQETDLQPGQIGEYMGTEPSTGMHTVLWMGKQWDNNKEFEPWGAMGTHFQSYLLPRPDLPPPGPAIRRRR
jgi:hypothetical protein